ncbi:MAG: hypothetical protein LBD22_03950 [Spirochaetaceae bacterium]|nr:hypothetical protein [Spirochaetaceae bacterium]
MNRKHIKKGAAAFLLTLIFIITACDNGSTSNSNPSLSKAEEVAVALNRDFGGASRVIASVDATDKTIVNIINPLVISANDYTLGLDRTVILKATTTGYISADGKKFTLNGDGTIWAAGSGSLRLGTAQTSQIALGSGSTIRYGDTAAASTAGTGSIILAPGARFIVDADLAGIPSVISATGLSLTINTGKTLNLNTNLPFDTMNVLGTVTLTGNPKLSAAKGLNISDTGKIDAAANAIIEFAANAFLAGISTSKSGTGTDHDVTITDWTLTPAATADLKAYMDGTLIESVTPDGSSSSGNGRIEAVNMLTLTATTPTALNKDTLFAVSYR